MEEIIAKRTETSKHYLLDNGQSQVDIHNFPIHYREDYSNLKSDWIDINAEYKEYYTDRLVYSRMPIVVSIYQDKIGYEIFDRKTNSTQKVELMFVDGSVAGKATDYPDITFSFDISQNGVRLWKRSTTNKVLKWKITDMEINDLYFREDPEALDDQNNQVTIDTTIERIDDENFYYIENIPANVLVDTDFTTASDSTRLTGTSTDYGIARSTVATGMAGCWPYLNLNVGQYYYQSYYYVYRSFLAFDTSVIGANNTITSAELWIIVQGNSSDTDFDVQICEYNWQSLVCDYKAQNYSGCIEMANSILWRNTSEIVGSYYGNCNAEPLTKSYIKKTGITRYAIRSSRDKAAIPPTGSEFLTLPTHNSANHPYLRVFFEEGVPFIPRITII